jgi:hypothetical protein
MSLLGKVLLGAGCVLFVCAVGWWYLFFEQFLGEDVKDASSCFYVTSDVCSLAEYAAIMSDIPAYSPWALWAAASAVIVGVFILAFSPR